MRPCLGSVSLWSLYRHCAELVITALNVTEVVKHPDITFVIGGSKNVSLNKEKLLEKYFFEDLLKWDCDIVVVSLMGFGQQLYDY